MTSNGPRWHPTRRETLIGAAGAAALTASGKLVAQTAEGQPLIGDPVLPDVPAKRLGWAIVGLGTFAIGQVIPGFAGARHSHISAFVSGNPDKAKLLAARYGVERIYSYANFDAIAEDPSIDCVYIVLPVGLHAEYTIRALKAGKHVLCEKPMASSPAEAEAMIAAAEAADRKLGVAYRVHFEPNNVHVLGRVNSGALGEMRYISADHGFSANPDYPPHKWRLEKELGGGGSLWDIGIYGINTSLMMLPGDHVTSASAAYATPDGDPRFSQVEGAIDYRLRMASGINVQGSSSYCYSPYVSRQRYFGSDASIEMQPATTYYDNEIRFEGAGHAPRTYRAGNAESQFAAQVDGFSRAARGEDTVRTPGEMGLRDLRIMEACYASANRGGAVVEIDIPV
ncbi:gfo/Idh/MocA family oxidoreductase [Altererythrobacter luteolus]|uniref:Gfo/Idh/MocA family oxidoreductase n=1 Tax=Pontixanthobacter luteolus TaxID=295089 RepID=A0A6I4V4D1_9SPHN|nr:Gfo/Idh/MocA family oxidoreductase [Pontixanthobacter luteolus]MXP48231.1 gfo/Idh/MocA family oxidoreductase [Pontixanthobacter luteolus]